MTDRRPLRFGSVCSGIEAASSAWDALGWLPVWFSEIDAFPSAILAHHYPDVPNLGDMTRLPARILAGEVEAPDVFVGGTPCQSFSVAGLRKGLEDPRGQLTRSFVEIADAIDTVRAAKGLPPVIILWENVPGVLSDKGNAFGNFLGALAGEDIALDPSRGKWTNAGLVLGPTREVAWRVLDAQYFGVAQRRRRVFVVAGSRTGRVRPSQVLLVEQGVRRDSPPSREAGQRPAPTLAARTRGGGGLGTDFDLDGGLVRHDGGVGGVGGVATQSDVAGPLDANYYKGPGSRQGGEREYVAHVVAPPLTATNDPSHSPQSSEVTQQVEAVLRAQYPEVTAPTICMAHGQGGAEVREDGGAPTLTCNHEAPIAVYAHHGGGLNGQDAYTGRVLPVMARAVHENQRAEVTLSAVVGTLKCAGGKPGKGYPAVLSANESSPSAVPYDLFQITAPINRQNRDQNSPCHTLARDNAAHAAVVLPDTPIVPALSVAMRGRDGGATAELGGEQAGTLRAATGGGDKPHVLTAMSVRRLTPTECERLQGFPDEYTRIPWKSKPMSECPDGPRYKALGNSMAVPVMRWIGTKIDKEHRRDT